MDATRFREQAALCRRLANQATTADSAERLRALALAYDEMAERVARKKEKARFEREAAAGATT